MHRGKESRGRITSGPFCCSAGVLEFGQMLFHF